MIAVHNPGRPLAAVGGGPGAGGRGGRHPAAARVSGRPARSAGAAVVHRGRLRGHRPRAQPQALRAAADAAQRSSTGNLFTTTTPTYAQAITFYFSSFLYLTS